jgi:hypothetical protein
VNRLDTPPSEEAPEELPERISEFPEEIRDDVIGLAWLGFLQDTVHIWGHTFEIRTLRVGEELKIGTLTKKYADTIGEENAIAAATVALALKSVDGDPDFVKTASKFDDEAEVRFRYVLDHWFTPVIQRVFDAYIPLITRQRAALAEMEDLYEGSLGMFIPSPDSSTEKEDFESVPEAEMQSIVDSIDSSEDSLNS